VRDERWTTVTPSQFNHERDALAQIRQYLPDTEPYRAWSNFTFTADTGHVYEVDLLIAAPSGLYLIEVKSLRGRLTSSGSNWILTNQSARTFDNPLHLADLKAKRLRSLLDRRGGQTPQGRSPFIQGAVFLSNPMLEIGLADFQLHWVFGPEPAPGAQPGPLPGVWSGLLRQPPRDERHRITPSLSRALPKALAEVGIARSRRYYRVGSWQLDARPMDSGPTWQDHLARHEAFAKEFRRIRIYLVERNSAQEERASIERAARREMLALHGISHPGIVQVDTMEPHEGGPALVFRHDPRAMRLDHFMAQYADRLDAGARIDMIRQLAEAVAYAHGQRLYHRALSARSVLVSPAAEHAAEAADSGWLHPRLQISDWQAAVRGTESTGSGTTTTGPAGPPTHDGAHLERASAPYLAPELGTPAPDPVALDVFGLGTLTYLLLSGQPPATTRAELLTRLSHEDGLRPSSASDSASEFMDELVQAATSPVPARRLSSVAEFLELLESVEDELTRPSLDTAPAAPADVLEAKVGDVVSDWEIIKKLGTGSTSRAFLARNLRTNAHEVLKVALSDEKAGRLVHEAEVLRGIHKDSRIIRLAREEPIEIPPRIMIVLEHAGEKTVARKLREDGRLTVDELETFSDYLFGAVDHLQGEGVTHRDIKPDNIAIRIRPNRTRQLVLFDFSLASVSARNVDAGTPRYLDPFLGMADRPVYDDHAERYAVAVTLHEMASGELPVWGDGGTEPRYTEGPPALAVEAFDPAIRDGLTDFFLKALGRDVSRRHSCLKEMRDSWQQIFRLSDHTALVPSLHPTGSATDAAQVDRETAAARATRSTVLDASGLSPRAISAAHRFNATTVGDLLALGSKELFTLPGLGAKTRRELQRRVKQWRDRLGEQERSPLAPQERTAATQEITAAHATPGHDSAQLDDFLRLGLDAVTARLVPAETRSGRNHTEVEAIRLLLRLPDIDGNLPGLPPWPRHPLVAQVVGVTPGRIAQILIGQRKRWLADPVVTGLHSEIADLLGENGRVMSAAELASAILVRRGSTRTGDELRKAIAMAAVRAAVEIDALVPEPRFLTRRHGERLLIALEVGSDDPPDTPAGPALLDHADALGIVADRLARQEILPSPATVWRELSTVASRGRSVGVMLDDRRTVQLAAIASDHAAASPRLELYPRDLDPVRALRLSQAGVLPAASDTGRPPTLTPDQIRDRVRARFPELADLPGHPRLEKLLTTAGFDLVWREGSYRVRPGANSSTRMNSIRRRSTATDPSPWTTESPEIASAAQTEQLLLSARAAGGFRVLTVRIDRYQPARRELIQRFEARAVNVAEGFVASLRALVTARPKPTWQTVLSADAAPPNSRDALKLAEFTSRAWEELRPGLLSRLDRSGPLLLHDGAPLARYRAMDLLNELAEAARGGAGCLWLLCPMEDPSQLPRLDATVVPVASHEWIQLTDVWVGNQHRSTRAGG
jgi:serine/threonine protein kinase